MTDKKKELLLFTPELGVKWAECGIDKKDKIYIEGEATFETRAWDDKFNQGAKNKFIKFKLKSGELVSIMAKSKKGEPPILGQYNSDEKKFEAFPVRLEPKYYDSFKAYYGLVWKGIKEKDEYWENDYHYFEITDACKVIDLEQEKLPDTFDEPASKVPSEDDPDIDFGV